MPHNQPPSLRSRIGNPVRGADFWPRPEIVDRLCDDMLNDRGSRRLFGLRRIGKTSILHEVERRFQSDAKLPIIRMDVQSIPRLGDFLDQIFLQLPQEEKKLENFRKTLTTNPIVKSLLSATFRRLEGTTAPTESGSLKNEFDFSNAWSGDIQAALKEVGPLILMIDELPFMLRNMKKDGYPARDIERFLAMLRDWRLNCGVRMILSGSLGLAQLRRLDGVQVADTIGDIQPIQLPPLTHQNAIAMVDALAAGENTADWTAALSQAIVDASAETWPIFLQYGFDAVRRAGCRDPLQVKAILDRDVRSAINENFYEQFTTRLSRYEKDEGGARKILKLISKEHAARLDDVDKILGDGPDRDNLLEALIEDDFIQIDTEAQEIRPASRLVPIWIRARAWGR